MTATPETSPHRRQLIEALDHPDPVLQADAAHLLGACCDRAAVPPLCRYVTTCRHNHKTAGIAALARLGDGRAVDALRPLVARPNVNDDWYWTSHKAVRAAAAVALLALGDEGGVGYLHELAEAGDNVFHAWYAPELLRLAATEPLAQPLAKHITVASLVPGEEASMRRTNPSFVVFVAEALGLLAIDDADAAAQLHHLLSWRSRYVRAQAARSLLAADPAHAPAVRTQLEQEPTDFARIAMAAALADRGDDAPIALIVRAASDADDPLDRAAAVAALGQLDRPAHRQCVIDALADPDAYVRLCAVEACRVLAVEPATIEPLADDPSPRVRLQVARALAA